MYRKRKAKRGAVVAGCAATSLIVAAIAFGQKPPPLPTSPSAVASQSASSQPTRRTREQVEALIQQAGSTKPDWFDSVELKVPDPEKLDLTWPDKNTPGRHDLGSYMWSVIGSNPKRYKEGTKLLHHALMVNKDNKLALAKTMNSLGEAYYDLLEDYPRAAFWWRKAMRMEPGRWDFHTLHLARCYYKMGCREMATEIAARFPVDNWRHADVIRLWAEMGLPAKALAMIEPKARAGMPDSAYLAAGDIYRQQSQFKQALTYYQKVLAVTQGTRDLEYNQKRAQRNIDAIQLIDALDLKRVPDGTYTGSAPSFIEDITVKVVVRQGRIESVEMVQSKDDRPLTAWTETPAAIVRKQGLKGVDVVSGATVTSDAIIAASGKALQSGMK